MSVLLIQPSKPHLEHPFSTTSDMIEWNVYVGVIVEAKAWRIGWSEVSTNTTSCCFLLEVSNVSFR